MKNFLEYIRNLEYNASVKGKIIGNVLSVPCFVIVLTVFFGIATIFGDGDHPNPGILWFGILPGIILGFYVYCLSLRKFPKK